MRIMTIKLNNNDKSTDALIALVPPIGIMICAFLVRDQVGVFTPEMIKTICVILAAVILWVKKPIPLAVSSLVMLILLPRLALVKDLNEAFSGFTNSTNYFIIASFGLAIAVEKTTISGTILKKFLAASKGRGKYIVLAFMAMTFVVSSVMSDIPAVMIGIAFARLLLENINEEDRLALGKPIMLAIPFGSVLGGTSTPAGSSVNVMALNILNANTGINISFLQWCALGLPVSLILLFVGWFIITKLNPVKDLTAGQMDSFIKSVSSKNTSALKNEKAVVAIIILMIVAWVAGTWVKSLDMTTVAIAGLFLMFMPGIEAFSWKEFATKMPWEIFIMGGTTIMLGNLARSTGLVQLLVNLIKSRFDGISAPMMVVLLGVLVTAILVIMPVGPATVSMLVMPAYELSLAMGVNYLVSVITLGVFASNCCILPLNSVMLISYGTGYWKITDLIKAGILITVVWLALGSIWYPLAASLVI